MGHADDPLGHTLRGRVVQEAVEQGDQGLAPFEREALVADVLRVQEPLEALGLDQLLEHSPFAGRIERGIVPGRFHPLLEPVLPLRVGDVHVLDPDVPAVGVAQDLEDFPQRRLVLAGKPVSDELAVEVPHREAVGRGVEVAVGRPLGVEGVEIGHEMPAHAVGVDELEDAGLLLHFLLAAGGPEEAGVDVGLRAHRPVRQAEVLEDALVEAVVALQQLFHPRQEEARLGALDDAVVVGRADGHDLADAEEPEGAGGHRPVLGRIVEAAGGDDHALPGHEARRRRGGAHGAGVGERDRGAHEVVGRDRALARASHELVEGLQKGGEIELARVLDVGHEQGAAAVLLLHVDRDAEADLIALDAVRSRLELGVGVVHARESVERPQDRPGHDVGEADLALARGLAVLVEDAAVLLEGADREVPHRGRGGNVEARLHVLHDAQGPAADGLGDVAGEDRGDDHRPGTCRGRGRSRGRRSA